MFDIHGRYTDAVIYSDICEPEALSQIYDLCNHPIFEGAKIRIMPDVHAGVGCTVGTTVEMQRPALIPSVVGSDIGCGVLTVLFEADELNFEQLDRFIVEKIPYGMSLRKNIHPKLSRKVKEEVEVLCDDLKMYKSKSAFLRCVGTLGGGNHYIEIGKAESGLYALSIHSGSRAVGKCVGEYYSDVAKTYVNIKGITGIKRSMPYIEEEALEGYLKQMERCCNIAAESRRLMAFDILSFLGVNTFDSFDTVHNFVETAPNGSLLIRKGAVPAKAGQRLAIPLNMRDGVFVCEGIGNEDWNFSAPHGAGRLISRAEAKASLTLEEFKEAMKGISTWSVCAGTVDESPMAYKPWQSIASKIGETVRITERIIPLYNFKARTHVGGK